MQSSERQTRIQRVALVCMLPLSFSAFLCSQSSLMQSDLLCHHQPRNIILQDSFIPSFILNMLCRWQRLRMGKRAAAIFFWRSSGSSCDTRSLNIALPSLAPQRSERGMYTLAEGTRLTFTASSQKQTQKAKKTFKETQGRWNIYVAGVTGRMKVLSRSHTARCMFCLCCGSQYRTGYSSFSCQSERPEPTHTFIQNLCLVFWTSCTRLNSF